MTSLFLAIIVGHTWRSPGAYSEALRESEHEFNCNFAQYIMAESIGMPNMVTGVFYRDGVGVTGAYANARAWGSRGGDTKFATIELHFNSTTAGPREMTTQDGKYFGCETLYVKDNSKLFAEIMQKQLVRYAGLKDRGAKKPWAGRGEANLIAIPEPSILIEPFFGSDADDALYVSADLPRLATAVIIGATEFLKGGE